MVVDAVALVFLVPGGGLYVFAAVFVPVDVGFVAEDAGVFLADVGGAQERADVEADAVVQVGVPADGLFFDWLPAHEDVAGGLAFADELEAFLERFGGG